MSPNLNMCSGWEALGLTVTCSFILSFSGTTVVIVTITPCHYAGSHPFTRTLLHMVTHYEIPTTNSRTSTEKCEASCYRDYD